MKGIKKVLSASVFVLLLSTIFVITASISTAAEGEVSIKDAMDSGDITVTFVSKGAASGHIVDLLIESNSNSDITLDLANSGLEGMVLANPDDEEQDEVITETPGTITGGSIFNPKDNVTLEAGKSVIVAVMGYCMNFDLDTPSTSLEYDLSSTSQKSSINEISSVVDTLDTYDFPSGWQSPHIQRVEQMAIWTSQQDNNNVPLSRYSERGYGLDDNDIEIVKDILNRSGKDSSSVAALTGLEKEDDEDSSILDEIPWFVIPLIIVAIILVSIIGGARSMRRKKRKKKHPHYPQTPAQLMALNFYKKKRKECEELNKKCKEARSKAQEAQQKAKTADSNLSETKSTSDKAKTDREQAELEFEEFENDKKEKEESWAESDGKHVSSYDLKLKNESSKDLWKQYQDGEIDAKILEQKWKDLGEDDALEELRKKDKEDRELPLQDALELAKLNEVEAKSKAKAAEETANKANDYVQRTKEYADKLCKKARECNMAAKEAYEAAGLGSNKKPSQSKVKDADKKSPEKETEPQEEIEEPEEPEIEDDEDDLEIEGDALEELDSDENKDKETTSKDK